MLQGLGVGPVAGVITTSECTRAYEIDFSKTPTISSILSAPLYPNNKGLNSWSNLLSLPASLRIKEVHVKVKTALSGTIAGTETIDLQVKHPRLGASFVDLTAAPILTATAGIVASNTYASAISDQTLFNRALTRFRGDSETLQLQLAVSANDITAGVLEIQLIYEQAYHNYTS